MADLMDGWSRCAKAAAVCAGIVVLGALYLLNHSPKSQVWVVEEGVLVALFAMIVAGVVGGICGLVVLARGSVRS